MLIIRLLSTTFLIQIVFASLVSAQATMERTAKKQPAQQLAPALQLAGVFGDNMVLQQKTDAPIWGFAKPGETVSVAGSWNQAVSKTKADEQGKWRTKLATPAAGGPFQILVKSKTKTVKLDNVLSGEVWVCSGQSNMQWRMNGFGVDHFAAAVAKANQPQIRYCQVPFVLALERQDDVRTNWSECNTNSVLNYSAVAYFFANRLHKEINVPIGLVSTNWGGSPAEAWVNEEVIKKEFPEFNQVRKQFPKFIEQHGVTHARGKKMPKGIKHGLPSVLYNQMIHPLMPFSIRGVIWYQGESNVKKPDQYRKLFPALIESWRKEWGQGDFPFYYVQIAPFSYKRNSLPAALLREAQLQSLSVPNTGMAVTMDIGMANNIHPKKKQPVGDRLALLALAKNYGRKDLVYSGPVYKSHEVNSDRIRLKFDHVGGGLTSRDGAELSHFTIAGEDKLFVAAQATIEGDTVVVRSENIKRPVAVRYAWGNADNPNLMNKESLPASSFRTDDWPHKK
jgi:sialate O-acetylesterase